MQPDKWGKKEREQEICVHRVQVNSGLLSPINHMVTIIIKVWVMASDMCKPPPLLKIQYIYDGCRYNVNTDLYHSFFNPFWSPGERNKNTNATWFCLMTLKPLKRYSVSCYCSPSLQELTATSWVERLLLHHQTPVIRIFFCVPAVGPAPAPSPPALWRTRMAPMRSPWAGWV